MMLSMKTLLVEIGTEELPPSLLVSAAGEIGRRLVARLAASGLEVGPVRLFATPRRLAALIPRIPDLSCPVEVELQGPPKRAAFDAEGKPTNAALGFAKAQGKPPAALYTRTTDKGEYVFVRTSPPPAASADVVRQALPEVLTGIPFPKTMRWQNGASRFPRPIRWLLCLLGSDVIPFDHAGLRADRFTRGHRSIANPIHVPSPDSYERLLREGSVIADFDERRTIVQQRVGDIAAEVGGCVVRDDELIEETTSITEWPEPILCSFAPDFLLLPRELVTTALKKHQRCFSVCERDSSALLPYFIAIANTPDCNHGQVRTWHEKAVDSRLRDSRFFFEHDIAVGLDPLVEEEKNVVWLGNMGTLHDKTERLRAICRHLAAAADVDQRLLDRAALLCKADLLTRVVREKEFTSLQGVIGSIIAERRGEKPEVVAAIREHYLPRFSGDRLPTSMPAALLSIADKIDNVTAAFAAGAVPTGSEDPLALRRQATSLLLTILGVRLSISIDKLIATMIRLFPNPHPDTVLRLAEFLRERMAMLLSEKGIRYDIARAVLTTSWHTPIEALERARALADFRCDPGFGLLVTGQKRLANILRNQTVTELPDDRLMVDEPERRLWQEARSVESLLDRSLEVADYRGGLDLLLRLRPAIDTFFDKVLVMDPAPATRDNRLRLVGYVRRLFLRIADLSEVVTEGVRSDTGQPSKESM